jgi:pilus assembly protein FimV
MSRGPYPALMMLAMSLPGTAQALGLGDIRVDSALNEPLSAQIEILGATPEELATLTARVADSDAFQDHGADRSSYLTSVTFEVGMNAQARPVLIVRSAVPCVEPVVILLVDIRWLKGELVRDYSLLLDPALVSTSRPTAAPAVPEGSALATATSLTAPTPALDTAPVIEHASPGAPATVPALAPTSAATPQRSAIPTGSPYRVLAGDTLSSIVRRAGAIATSDAQRMMIAVFRAAPRAFDGNINLLHRGAMLAMPASSATLGIGAAEAEHEVAAQMRAWRLRGAQAGFRSDNPVPAPAQQPAESAGVEALNRRVQELEQALASVRQQLASENAAIQSLQQLAALPAIAVPAQATKTMPAPGAAHLRSRLNATLLGPVTLTLGFLLAMFALLRSRRSVSAPAPAVTDQASAPSKPNLDLDGQRPGEAAASVQTVTLPAGLEATVSMEMEIEMNLPESAYVDETGAAPSVADASTGDTAVLDGVQVDESTMNIVDSSTPGKLVQSTVLDYNLVDLDSSALHVHMPSELNDRPVLRERRTSIVDALRSAIMRDPQRRDLRLKLLQTYYTVASANQRAFLEFARMQAAESNGLSAEDWQMIMAMGREIAPDDSLFAEQEAKDLADCA